MTSSSAGCSRAPVSLMRSISRGASISGVSTRAAICSARSGRSGSSTSAVRCCSISRVALRMALGDQRLVVVAVAQLAGEVGDHRVAALGGQLEPVQHAAELVAGAPDELAGALQPAREDRHHGGAREVGALLGDEQPVAGLLERRRAVQALDAVVRQRALEQVDEALGQPLGLRVERAQERVQVLLRAVQQLALRVVAGAAQRAHVGEDVEQPVLGLDQRRRCDRPRGRRRARGAPRRR